MPLERKWHRCRKSLGAWSDTEPNRMGALRIDKGGLKPEVPTDLQLHDALQLQLTHVRCSVRPALRRATHVHDG